MPGVQEQEQDLTSAYPVCSQAALPRAGVDEHCGTDVHQAVWSVASLEAWQLSVRQGWDAPRFPIPLQLLSAWLLRLLPKFFASYGLTLLRLLISPSQSGSISVDRALLSRLLGRQAGVGIVY